MRDVARFRSLKPLRATCTSLSPRAIFAGTERNGFYVITSDGAERYGQAQGAPGDRVTAMAWLEPALYVSYSGVVAKLDLATRKIDVLASSGSVAGRHGLDGGTAYEVKSMVADPARDCIWLAIAGCGSGQRDGVWKHTVGSERFERVFDGARPDRMMRLDGVVFFETWVLPGTTLPNTPDVGFAGRPGVLALQPGAEQFALSDSSRHVNHYEVSELLRTTREEGGAFVRLVHYDGRHAIASAHINHHASGRTSKRLELMFIELRESARGNEDKENR
jgi:hypothetical protein